MKCLLSLLILIDCLSVQGILEWTVVGKVTDYGQNVTLFCNVPHCCPEDSGWDRWTPVQQTLFIDIKTGRPNKKYDGKVMKDGYTLIIQNLTENDLNVSYSCLYGVTFGERKFLLKEDVFKSTSPTQPNSNGQLSHSEISALIIGVIVLLLGSVTIFIYFWRRRIQRNNHEVTPLVIVSKNDDTHKIDIEDCSHLKDTLLDKTTVQKGKDDNLEIEEELEDTQAERKEDNLEIIKDNSEKIMKKATEPKECIPKNIRDQMQRQIEDWETKDKMFVSTRASDFVINCLNENSCLTLTAPSGAGKTYITRHTALVLQKAGYKIVPVIQPDDIRNFYQPGRQTVFVVDDICGNFTANQQQIDNWKQLLPVIDTIIADKCCKIIVSCRLQVYKDDKFNILLPFKSCECNLISDNLSLTSAEKLTIATKYFGSGMIDIGKLSQHSEFFPLLCSLYQREKHGDVKEFFENPFIVYRNELDSLGRHGDEGNYKICSLALLVLFNNQVSENWFQGKVTDEERHIIEVICEACEFNFVPKSKLKKVFESLVDTFIYKKNGIYSTVHDKLFDFLAHYFGKKMIECLIDHGDSYLVHERLIWQKSTNDETNNIDFMIKVPNDYSESYIQRFIKDWSEGKVAVVFSNNNMKVSSFRQKLLENLKQLNKPMQVTLANTKDTVLPKENCLSGTTPLICTCYGGYTDMVEWILRNGVDVDQCRDDGVSGLLMASQEGYTDIVNLLLEKNPDVNLCGKNGLSPLLQASQNGHTDIVKLLLERNPDVNLCKKDGTSPLLQAGQNGHTDIVKLLLERNPDVNLCNKDGLSPLLQASQNGHTDIVKLLLERNPDVNLCDNDGLSPLLLASQNGHTDIVKLLLERNTDVNLCDKDGLSPLLQASQQGHTDIVKLLLERNSDVNLCNKDGLSPLLQASQQGHTDIVKLLLERNPDVNLCKKDGTSPLLQAGQNGHTDIVKLLLERNPDVNLCNKDGLSPLLQASQNGHTDIVKLLLERNPDVNLCDNDGLSPLLLASQNGHTDIVKLLLERNTDVNLCNNDNCSPLLKASDGGHTDIVKLLLERNPDVNLCNKDGLSPLLQASQQGHTDIVKLLLERNSDVNLCNKDGLSPLLQASQQGHTDIVKLLLENNPVPCDNTSLSTSYVNNNIRMINSQSLVQPLMKHKPDINAQTNDGGNALYFSACNGHIEIVKLLLENNADSSICIFSKQYIAEMIKKHPTGTLGVLKQNIFDTLVKSTLSCVTSYVSKKSVEYAFDVVAGSSPLHIACFMGRIDVVSCLLDHNANINMTKDDGITPLWYACELGHQDIVRLLLDNKADTKMCKNDGKSPSEIATDNGHTSIVDIVKEYIKKEKHV